MITKLDENNDSCGLPMTRIGNNALDDLYRSKVMNTGITSDTAQIAVIKQLQLCLDALNAQPNSTLKKWYRKRQAKRNKSSLGVYIWGPVGRGKTMLMDLFCQCLNTERYLRLHFHRFMEMIHQQLFIHSGEADPLKHIAQKLSEQYDVICFDEFFVSDIGDAMLLGRLYQALFDQGTVIVSTSNTEPSQLYYDGLHRDRFLPTIELIYSRMQSIHLDNGIDHRHRTLTHQKAFFVSNEEALAGIFNQLTAHCVKNSTFKEVQLSKRTLRCNARRGKTIWFNFSDLCQGARSSRDYIELASDYQHIILSEVPQFKGSEKEQIKARGTEDGSGELNTTGLRNVTQNNLDDAARRFISLVDELYDSQVNLFISAHCKMEHLYQGELLCHPFKRTLSRLHEMSSAEYQKLSIDLITEQMDYSASQHQTLNLVHDQG